MKLAVRRIVGFYGPQVAWLAAAIAVACACGLAVSRSSFIVAVGIPVAALGAVLLPLVDAGIVVGLALIAANNALPGIDLTNITVSGAVNGTDLAFLAIFGFAVFRRFCAPAIGSRGLAYSLLVGWSLVFLALWSLDFVRALDAGTQPLQALSTGRDFLYFALALPFAGSLITNKRELRQCCVVISIFSVLFACADIGASLGIASPAIANALLTRSQGSLVRIYNSSYYLFELTFSMSLAYAFLHKGRDARIASIVAAVTGVALMLSFTRALYIGVFLALVLTFTIWGIGQGSAHRLLRRRLLITASIAVVAGATMLISIPGSLTSGPVQTVVTRATSATSALSSSSTTSSTVAYRNNIDSRMLQTLGTRWPFGLGLLSPQTNYFGDLPHGSIRNDDVGIFNSIMTMGVIGTILLYLLPVWVLCVLIRSALQGDQGDSYLRLGGMIWLLVILITFYSLGSLASVSGLATTTVGVGILLRMARLPRREVAEATSLDTQLPVITRYRTGEPPAATAGSSG
jgi:hypothetical protein